MYRFGCSLCSLAFLLNASAATPPADLPNETEGQLAFSIPSQHGTSQRTQTRGGSLSIRWFDDLTPQIGIRKIVNYKAFSGGFRGEQQFALSDDRSILISAKGRHLDSPSGGEWQWQGGAVLHTKAGLIDLRDARWVVRPGDAVRMDLISRNGKSYLFADKMMYELVDGGKTFRIRSMDLRIAPALAKMLGESSFNGLVIGEVHALAPLQVPMSYPKAAGDPNWPGEAAPNGNIYRADVFMSTFNVSGSGGFGGCATGTTCDGPGGASDGLIKLTPSSTLRNNVNNGVQSETISTGGNGLGTSSVLYAADVPWYDKFTSSPAGNPNFAYPYMNNDVHPNLIWNYYRVDTNGALTQIGRSGMKHAFLTTNTGTGCDNSNGSHVLGRSCSDTYGVGNNNNPGDLGPRSELIPSRGVWGRCGSIFDPTCDGTENTPPADAFRDRMLVRESAMEACRSGVAGNGRCWFESWYVIRDDVNIYNTMATRGLTPNWSGTAWSVSDAGAGNEEYRLGSAIDRWIADPLLPPATTHVAELSQREGRTKIGLRARDLGNGQWRYDYSVMNFDFSIPYTNENFSSIGLPGAHPCTIFGQEENHTLCVIRNDGFDAFTIPLGGNVTIQSIEFADSDIDNSNNWTSSVVGNALRFEAPNRAASLNWGSMLRFTVIANQAPFAGNLVLDVTEVTAPIANYSLPSLGIGEPVVVLPDALFENGFEDLGL